MIICAFTADETLSMQLHVPLEVPIFITWWMKITWASKFGSQKFYIFTILHSKSTLLNSTQHLIPLWQGNPPNTLTQCMTEKTNTSCTEIALVQTLGLSLICQHKFKNYTLLHNSGNYRTLTSILLELWDNQSHGAGIIGIH